MYQKHPEFEEPSNENIKIWRYLDFTKFVSYLDRKALFFTRADKLDDRFEGKFTDSYEDMIAFHSLQPPLTTIFCLTQCITHAEYCKGS